VDSVIAELKITLLPCGLLEVSEQDTAKKAAINTNKIHFINPPQKILTP
jgi:hypothetical protein